MKKIFAGCLLLCLSSIALAEYCFYSREEVSGESKFCFYKCAFGEKVVTVRNLDRCNPMLEFSALPLSKQLKLASLSENVSACKYSDLEQKSQDN